MKLSDFLTQISVALKKTYEEAAFLPLSPAELDLATNAYFARGGKLIRPALCLCTAAALGHKNAARRALPAALATELFHLFTLVQDDVIDHDTLRRGAKTAHILAAEESRLSKTVRAEYGTSIAILAGDALFSRSVELLSKAEGLSDEARLSLILRLSSRTLPLLLSGEAVDTRLGYQTQLPSEEEITTVYRNKTGVLFEFALFAGAVCAENGMPSEKLCAAIENAGANIGEAFQLTDDYLGLTASEEAMGKSALSDIREGKQTFFVREAYLRATEKEKLLLDATLGDEKAPIGAVRAVRDILLSYGKEGYEKKKQAARENAQMLLDCLEESEAKTLLSEIFDLMICREN